MTSASARNWSSIIKKIAQKAPGIIPKLRITPSVEGSDRIHSHYAVLKHAESLVDSGNQIIAIEAKVEDGYKAEADLVYRDLSGVIHYVDVTTSSDDDVIALKYAKAEQISAAEGVNYSVAVVPKVDRQYINYECNFNGPSKKIFKILEQTVANSATKDELEPRVKQVQEFMVEEVMKVKPVSLDRRWSAVPIELLQSNSTSSLKTALPIISNHIPEMAPFLSKLATCASLATRKLFYLYPAAVASTSEHPLIRCIKAIPESKSAYNITTNYELVEVEKMCKGLFSTEEGVIACVKRRFNTEHKFYYSNRYTIKFNRDYVGEDMANTIARQTNKIKPMLTESTMFKDLKSGNLDEIFSASYDYEEVSKLLCFTSDIPLDNFVDVYTKFITVASTDSHATDADTDSIFVKTRYLIAKLVASTQRTVAAQILSHYHEVAKTIASSISKSSRRHEYHVGRNGPYNSYTIVKCTGTQDSFKCAPYFVLYKPTACVSNMSKFVSEYSREGEFIRTNRRLATKNIINWHIKLPLTFINLLAWHTEQRLTVFEDMLEPHADFISSSAIFSVINRDPFAQVADLTRYWYGSSVGDHSDFLGLLSKYNTFIPKYISEVVYIARQIKMAACLRSYVLSKSDRYTVKDSQGSNAITLCMPHLDTVIAENSATISMFYISNIYNKYKYSAEISAAICYIQLKEELDIFNSTDREFMNGISNYNLDVESLNDIIFDDTRFSEELKFISRLINRKSERFQCSILLTYLYSRVYKPPFNESELFLELGKSPYEALTMRGGMEGSKVDESSQSIRAASTMIEGIVNTYGFDSVEFNQSGIYKGKVMAEIRDADVSLLALKNIQFATNPLYAYRVVHKDQKGHREISVLNYEMRIGTYFLEAIFKFIARGDDTDLLQNPDKLRVVQKYIRNLNYSKNKIIFDTTDQSRWGPNALMHHFGAMAIALLDNSVGLSRLALDSLDSMTTKQAKIPDNILSLIKLNHTKFNKLSVMGKIMDFVVPMVAHRQYALVMTPGMGQGILHQMSSTLHVIKGRASASIVKAIVPNTEIKDNTTSDDKLSAVSVPKGTTVEIDSIDDEVKSTKKLSIEAIYLRSNQIFDNVFNIIRNLAKSFLSRRLMDFNSSFYSEECLAVPSLKQRIAFIDCGDGEDLISDMVKAASSGSSYLSAGGSYIGATMLSISNMVLTFDQHNSWYKYKADHRSMTNRSVFAMGIPLIEPLSTLLYGPLTSVVLREIRATGLSPEVILRALLTNVTVPAELVAQEDLIRGSTTRQKEKFNYLMPSSVSGLITLFRPQKLQSRFIRRHKFESIYLDESKIHYRKGYPSFTNLLFTASLGVGTKINEENLGINNFLIRYTEPWVNVNAKKIKIANTAFAKALYMADCLSLKELEFKFSNMTNDHIISAYKVSSEFTGSEISSVLVTSLSELMTPAANLLSFLSTSYPIADSSRTRYSHVKMILPHKLIGDTSDVRKAMIKKLYIGNNTIFFNDPTEINFGATTESILEQSKTESLKEAIMLADLLYNSISKYARLKTTAIAKCSGDVLQYENAVSTFVGKMYSSTVPIKVNYDLTKITAPLSYVTLNNNLQKHLIVNRDDYTNLLVHRFTGDNVFDFKHKYIKSEKDVIQTAQNVTDFVDYETKVAFRLTSESSRSFSEELMALAGFQGDIYLTRNFVKLLSLGQLSSTTLINAVDCFVKVMVLPNSVYQTTEGYPCLLVNKSYGNQYVTVLYVFTFPGTTTAELSLEYDEKTTEKWKRSIYDTLNGVIHDGQISEIKDRLTGASDTITVSFVSLETPFKLKTDSPSGIFYLKSKSMIIPLRTNLIYNRPLLIDNLSKLDFPSGKVEPSITLKPIATFTSEVINQIFINGDVEIDSIIKLLNTLSYPCTTEDIDLFFSHTLTIDGEEVLLRDIAAGLGATDAILKNPDLSVAYFIAAIKSFFNIEIRVQTIKRTMLRPGKISKAAPLFFRSDSKDGRLKQMPIRIISDVFQNNDLPTIAEEHLTFEQETAMMSQGELEEEAEMLRLIMEENAEIKRQIPVNVERSSDAAGTVFSEEMFDYKVTQAEPYETYNTFDTMLITTDTPMGALLEEAKRRAYQMITANSNQGFNIFNVGNFLVNKFGKFNSKVMSLLMESEGFMGSTSYVLLCMS